MNKVRANDDKNHNFSPNSIFVFNNLRSDKPNCGAFNFLIEQCNGVNIVKKSIHGFVTYIFASFFAIFLCNQLSVILFDMKLK